MKKLVIRNHIPAFIKESIKFLLSARERKRILTENQIRKKQNQAIRKIDPLASRLIVFLSPGPDRETGHEKISGGLISIVSLCEESARLKNVHNAEVLLSTLPKERLIFRHTLFKSASDVFRFSQLSRHFRKLEEIILHLPEFTCAYFLESLSAADLYWLQKIKKVHINILNQNINLMPTAGTLAALKKLANLVTSTTAHQRYCSQYYRDYFGIPIHKFSVWISPEKYSFVSYLKKENLMVVSPDPHPQKQAVLDLLAGIHGLSVQIIKDLTYEEYKATIARAKWALTFGEGLDGYIIEPIFSGAIAFAVYNEDFFTPDFQSLATIYPSFDRLLSQLSMDIKRLDHEQEFIPYQQKQFDTCARHYSHAQYEENIRDFYQGHYTFN